MTSATTPEEMQRGIIRDPHCMIHASVDGREPPIYVSKFGPNGPVAAHTIEGALHNYPPQSVAVIGSLARIPFPPSVTE